MMGCSGAVTCVRSIELSKAPIDKIKKEMVVRYKSKIGHVDGIVTFGCYILLHIYPIGSL
jgi:hypothetical protein